MPTAWVTGGFCELLPESPRCAGRSSIRFDQIILAAPDVDVDVFRYLYPAYGKIARRTTLYTSQKDLAVAASRWIDQSPRVGYAPPIFVAPGLIRYWSQKLMFR